MHVVHDLTHRRHDPPTEVASGRTIGIYEVPERADRIHDALAADGAFTLAAPADHGLAPIQSVHDPELIAYLARAWEDWHRDDPATPAISDTYRHPGLRDGMGPGRAPRSGHGALGWWCFDTATPMVEGTYAAARAAVDVALTATDRVLTGDRHAYGLCRPPGHHAPRAAFGGYCYFNNAAIAAQHAIDHGGAMRVAVLDVDYHHGNGTQQLFYDRADVLYVSLHADPDRAYPYFTGFEDETGTGDGLGTTRNLVLAPGCDDPTYLDALDRGLSAVDRFGADVLIVSLGVDTYREDPIGDLAVTTELFAPAGAAVSALGLPTVVLQEGGYHLPTIAANVHAFLRGLAG